MMNAKIEIARFNKNDKLLEKRIFPCRSFTLHFIDTLYLLMTKTADPATVNIIDISNTSRAVNNSQSGPGSSSALGLGAPGGGQLFNIRAHSWESPGYHIASVVASDQVGIQVGSNNTAPIPTDYKMNTRILHGAAAGQLEYGGCELVNYVAVNPNSSFDIRRYFYNRSGGNVTVREAGLYSTNGVTGRWGEAAWLFCVARDAVAPDVAVADTEILRVTYTVQITV
jgi:hypothetical protein